jgi:chaperonin cofactor prefoldin
VLFVSLNQTIADIEKLVNTLNRYLSLRDEVEAQLADVERAIKVLTELNVIIEACQPPPQPPA